MSACKISTSRTITFQTKSTTPRTKTLFLNQGVELFKAASPTPFRNSRHSHKSRGAATRAALAILAAALTLPFAAAAPAQAATATPKVQAYGCTVTAEKPYALSNRDPYDQREIVMLYSYVTCTERAHLKVTTRGYENDGIPWLPNRIFAVRAVEMDLLPNIPRLVTWQQRVPDWDDDHRADIYQAVTFSRRWGQHPNYEWRSASRWAQSQETVIPIRNP